LDGRGKCLVLRLLYSYLARGTAIKKSAWCYVRTVASTDPGRVFAAGPR
jgi:hypothetical protein